MIFASVFIIQDYNSMKIKLILENYDKEKIAEIQKMKETLNDDDFFYQMRCLVRHDEKNFDAI